MAQEKYAYGSNTGDLFADDDPLAELARIVGYEQPSPRSQAPAPREEQVPVASPVKVAASSRPEPAFDLEDELLREFERYDAPGLDAAPGFDAAVAAEPARRAIPASEHPAFAAFEDVPEEPAPAVSHDIERIAAPGLADWDAAPAVREEENFAIDLADELELAVSPVDAPVAPPSGLRLPLSSYRASREEPTFEPEPKAAEPSLDVSHFSTASVAVKAVHEDFSFAPEPVAAVPEFQIDETIAADEFDLALDGLELDLSDIVMDEVDADKSAVQMNVAPVTPAAASVPDWNEPLSPIRETGLDGLMPFDASLVSDPDYAPETIAELDVPEMPVHETRDQASFQPAFDTDFDAEIADLFHNDHAAPAAAPVEAAAMRKPLPVDMDDFSFMLNEDFNPAANARPEAAPVRNRVVIDPDKMEYVPLEAETRRFGWKAAALASVAVLVSVTGLYAWFSSGSTAGGATGNGPPVVVADADPVKVVPENPGGKTVPNQDKAVYDRVAGGSPQAPTQKSLISSSEEPMDVVQRTLSPENFPTPRAEDEEMADEAEQRLQPGGGSESAGAETPAADANVSLRKVRTMIVRPDGSLVAREVPETAAPEQTAARLPAASPAANASEGSLSQVAASAVTDTSVRGARPASGESAPVPSLRPAEQPVNIVGTITGEGNVRQTPPAAAQEQASATPATVASATVPAGSYVVQIASLPSQAEAEKSYRTMSARYGNVIGGRGVDIKAADIPGKGTYYRVRIVAGAKADADAMCGKLKAAGGSCLVTR